ncbi:MAG: ATP-binding protein [Verrucomicrobiota bacterium]
MIYLSEGAASPYYAGLNLVLVTVCWVAQVTFRESMIAFATTTSMYLAACLAHGKIDHALFFNNTYFIVLTGITTVTGNYVLNRLRQREYTNRVALDASRRQLEEKNYQLNEMDRARSQFFANISHELRTPLTLIMAPIEQLLAEAKAKSTPAAEIEIFQVMYRNADRLLKLIDELLALAKSQADQTLIIPTRVDGNLLLQGLASSVKSFADKKKITIDLSLSSEPIWFLADIAKCEKVLLNLIFNALKFMDIGGTLKLSVEQDDSHILFCVEDDGPGISGEQLPHIFDPFWQGDGGATRKHQGAGLGLALVKQWVTAHGGDVSVSSTLGQGSCFSVRFPLPTAADLQTQTGYSKKPPEYRTPAPNYSEPLPVEWDQPVVREQAQVASEAPTVLVADDEPEMREYLADQLGKRYHIIKAQTGSEAVRLAIQHLPELILLDYMMPDLDGVEVCQSLKDNLHTAVIPIILVTARADHKTRIQALSAGATDFLTKPFGFEELHNRCANLIHLRQAQMVAAEKQEEAERALEELKVMESQLVQSAKVSSLGQLSAGLLHEVNNPITFCLGAVKALNNLTPTERNSEDYTEIIQDLSIGLNRAKTILFGLKRFAHPDQESIETLLLGDICAECERFVNHDLVGHKIEFDYSAVGQVELKANRNQLVHLILNMLQNSIDSLKDKQPQQGSDWQGRICVAASCEKADSITILLEDNGLGIEPEKVDQVLDPFFTTKPVGHGVGLGLSICHRIVLNHAGTIRVESVPGEKCLFIMEFPK